MTYQVQIRKLKFLEALKSNGCAKLSDLATFKLIIAGAPILNPAASPTNLSYASEEQSRLLEMIRTEKIAGLLFISGGKYHRTNPLGTY